MPSSGNSTLSGWVIFTRSLKIAPPRCLASVGPGDCARPRRRGSAPPACVQCIRMHTMLVMALVQVRDVPEDTVRALKAQAAERGLTLTAFLRDAFNRLAARPTNAEIVERLARRNRR